MKEIKEFLPGEKIEPNGLAMKINELIVAVNEITRVLNGEPEKPICAEVAGDCS